MSDDPLHPWTLRYGPLDWSHPHAPAGGTGPGFCRLPGPAFGAAEEWQKLLGGRSNVPWMAWQPPGTAAPSPAADNDPPIKDLSDEARFVAAVASGEGSTKDVFEELAAIAATLLRIRKATGYSSSSAFVEANPNYTYAVSHPNDRYKNLMKASIRQINDSKTMKLAVKAALHALDGTKADHSNGAYYWDGVDLRTNYANHPKVKQGIRFTNSAHNVLGVKEKDVPGEEWWLDKDKKKTKSRGKWDYAWESTAGLGQTIFWKLNAAYLKANGMQQTSGLKRSK